MPSYYGLGLYGKGLYSAVSTYSLTGGITPSIVLHGDLGIAGKASLSGDLDPAISLSASLTRILSLRGDMAPSTTFAAGGFGSQNMFADLAPEIDLGASLAVNRAWGGYFPLQIIFAAELTSGPLWQPVEPCEVVWVEMETCCD